MTEASLRQKVRSKELIIGPSPVAGGKRFKTNASHPSLVHRMSGTCSSLFTGLEKLRRPRKTAKRAEMRRRSGSIPAVAIFTSTDSGDVSWSHDRAPAAEPEADKEIKMEK